MITNARSYSRASISTIVFVLGIFLVPSTTHALLYAPGATLDPGCGPTDVNCGIETTVVSSTANSIPYYATNGDVLSATSTVTILQTGDVGIGTTSPIATLDVQGNAFISGSISNVANINALGTVAAPIINAGSVLQLNGANINTAGTLSDVGYLNQSQIFTGFEQFDGNASTLSALSASLAYFGSSATSSFSSTGVLTLSSALGIGSGGTGTSTSGVADGIEYYNGSTITNGNGFVLSGGNVGIGTQTPSVPLDVNGIIRGDLEDTGGDEYDVRAFGVECNGQYVNGSVNGGTGISVSANSTSAAVASGQFTSADIGKTIMIDGIGFSTTIAAVPSSTQITLAAAPAQSASLSSYFYGTNDTAALTNLIDSISTSAGVVHTLKFPEGVCLTNTLYARPNMLWIGSGSGGWANNSPAQQNGATTIKAIADLSGNGLITESEPYYTNVTFQNIAFDGSSAYQTASTSDVYVPSNSTSQDPKWNFNNVYMFNASGDCLYVGLYQRASRIINSSFWQCGGNGARIETTDTDIESSVFGESAGNGLEIGGSTNHITNNDIFNNGAAGIYLEYTQAEAWITATGGTFTLTAATSSSATTSPIAYGASASTIQSAIQSLGSTLSGVTVSAPTDGSIWRIDNVPYGDSISANGSSLTGGSIAFVQSSAQYNRIIQNSIDSNGTNGIFVPQAYTTISSNRFDGNSRSQNLGYAVINVNYPHAPTPAGTIITNNTFAADFSTSNTPTYCIQATGGNISTISGNYGGCGSGLSNSNTILNPSFNPVSYSTPLMLNQSGLISGYSDSLDTVETLLLSPSTGGAFFAGNVGIGTISPYANLSVMAGGSYASLAASTVFAIGSSTAGTATSTLFDINSAGVVQISSLGTPAGAFLAVNGSGQIIATTTPSSGGSGTIGSGTAGYFPYYAANGTMLTATSSVFLSTSGFVGFGTTTPNSTLTISGSGVQGIVLDHDQGTLTNSEELFFTNTLAAVFGEYANSGDLELTYGGSIGSAHGTAGLVMTNAGKVGVGTTTPAAALAVHGSAYIDGNLTAANITAMSTLFAAKAGIGTTTPYAPLEIWGPDTASTSAFIVANSASTTVFSVYDNGNATYSGSIFQSSDQRLKTDITPLNASSSLAAIEGLTPVSYLRIDQSDQGTNLGFIAQAVQQVFPELVSTTTATALTPGGTLTVNYVGLIAPIISAMQALATEVDGFAQSITTAVLNATDINGTNITATQQLCVGGTCITGSQLQELMHNAGQAGTPGSENQTVITNVPTGAPSPDSAASSSSDTTTDIATSSADSAAISSDATSADMNESAGSPSNTGQFYSDDHVVVILNQLMQIDTELKQVKSELTLRKTALQTRARRFFRRNAFWASIIVGLSLLALAFELGRYSVYEANPSLRGQQQAAEIIHKVGQLIQLPAGEAPTMATINDAAAAKENQPFLASAEDGDVLIVYVNVGEALLYRPSTDKLVAVGPVEPPDAAPSQAETPIPQAAVTSTDATDTPTKK